MKIDGGFIFVLYVMDDDDDDDVYAYQNKRKK